MPCKVGCPQVVIEITPLMIAAGASELIVDAGSVPAFVVYDVLTSALEAGGYKIAIQEHRPASPTPSTGVSEGQAKQRK